MERQYASDDIQGLLKEIDIKGQLKGTLFSTTAERIANAIAADYCEKNKKTDSKNKKNDALNRTTQIRRFYDELLMWQEKVGDNQETFKNVEPFIQMMVAKTAYAYGRSYVGKIFLEFMKKLISQIDSPKTLNYAKLFFEAVLGFKKSLE